jgi:small subunit ribosomal protein S5
MSSGGKSKPSNKEKTPTASSKEKGDEGGHIKESEKPPKAELTGTEPLYPIYTDVNPLFDTYVKAHHQRTNRKDKHGNTQEYNVSTTVFNDPPLFMIEPRLRPTPRFPTRRYIESKYRTEAPFQSQGYSPKNGESEDDAMNRMDREHTMRKSGAAVDWGADDTELPYGGRTRGEVDRSQYESPLDEALDLQAWNSGDLMNDFDQWDQHATPSEETSSLPSPMEAQTLPPNVVSTLMRFPLISKRVVQQGGKGRMPSWYVLTVTGNGQGLVGVGEGKDAENPRAIEKSFIAACKDLDWIDRFEGRTLWNEIDTKWGATRILMRPRPMGFGLRCNPYIHQVGAALGFRANIGDSLFSTRSAKPPVSKIYPPKYGVLATA